MRLSQTVRQVLVGAVGAAAAFFVFGGARVLSGGRTAQPIDAVPKDSFLVATVNLAELRRSPVYESVFGGGPATNSALVTGKTMSALGMGGFAKACGFDPLARVETLAIAVPEGDDHGEFGIAARVQVTKNEIETCARALNGTEVRGGGTTSRNVGSFTVLEDAGGRAIGYGTGGLLIISKGPWFEAMLGSAEHKKATIEQSREHTALRTALTSRAGWRAPTAVVTTVLPRALRDRLKGERPEEQSDSSVEIMNGVLGVSAVGIAVRAGESGQNFDARAELVCDDAAACAAVKEFILKKKLAWSRDLGLRMVGVGALIDSLEIEHNGVNLHASVSVSVNQLSSAIERAMRWRARADSQHPRERQSPEAPEPPKAASTTAEPDLRIFARDAGAKAP